MLKATIDKDLKAAMLSGDKRLVEVLRGVKSAILYKEVADGKRDVGLSDEEIIGVLKKEQKSRRDAIALYEQANETARADEEKYQLTVIGTYTPEEMSEDDIRAVLSEVMTNLGIEQAEAKDMGRIIGAIKAKASNADGALVAKIVKEQLNS